MKTFKTLLNDLNGSNELLEGYFHDYRKAIAAGTADVKSPDNHATMAARTLTKDYNDYAKENAKKLEQNHRIPHLNAYVMAQNAMIAHAIGADSLGDDSKGRKLHENAAKKLLELSKHHRSKLFK